MHDSARTLNGLGQSLWLDNITRGMLRAGTLEDYRDRCAVTGLTSNPTIFEHAIKGGDDYDAAIRADASTDPEAVFFDLAIDDLRNAAKVFEPIHQRTSGVDGWVSLEVSPLLADDTAHTIEQAVALHERAGIANLYIKVPGTTAGAGAIEELIYRGVPINVTLLFSPKQYQAVADAYMKGLERRLAEGLSLDVAS
ncbi:MAG: transaldolase, partial [Rhodanobacter sp.]